jgi:excisionase family DNA binding protein
MTERWVNATKVAEHLGISVDRAYGLAAEGVLPSVKFGGHRRFRISEVDAWLEGQRDRPVSPREERWLT